MMKGLQVLKDRVLGAFKSHVSHFSLLSTKERIQRSKSGQFQIILQALFQSEWTAVAVKRIADAIAFNEWNIIDKQTKKPIENKDAAVVQIFKNPNPMQTYLEFIEELVWFWIPLGNAFIWKRPSLIPGIPAQLWVLRPDRIEIVPDDHLGIKEFRYNVGGSKPFTFPRDQIIHLKFPNPKHPFWGIGPIELSPRIYEMDIAAADYAFRFFENDATPGGTLETEKHLSDDSWNRLKEEWAEGYQGVKRAHRLSVLEDGLKFKSNNMGPREAQFLETRKTTREGILSLFGVPPLEAGIPEGSNRATAFVQKWLFQRNTIGPLLKRLEMKLTLIAELFGPQFEFKFDELIQEDNLEDADIAAKYFMLGSLKPNEVRTIYEGLPAIEDNPAMEMTYLPLNMIAVGEDRPLAAFSVDDKPDPPRLEGAVGNGHGNGKVNREWDIKLQKPEDISFRQPKGTPLQRRTLRHFRTEQLHQTRIMRREIARFFRQRGQIVMQRFLGLKSISKVVGDLFDPVEDEKAWRLVTTSMFSNALLEEFTVTAELFGFTPEEAFEPGNVRFDRRRLKLASKVTRVSLTTKAKLEAVVAQGIELGLNPTAIANGAPDLNYPGIRGTFEDFAQSRAQLIARTESARVLDQANTAVYKGLGVRVVDVIGCEDNIIQPGQKWGCNSQGVPIDEAETIEFHPNHKGAIVPRLTKAADITRAFVAMAQQA